MFRGIQHGCLRSGNQGADGRGCFNGDAHRHQIYTVSHQGIETITGLACGRHTDHHITCARNAMQQRSKAGQERCKQTGTLTRTSLAHGGK